MMIFWLTCLVGYPRTSALEPIAHTYFGKSASWLYHKLDGIDGNGGVGGFTEEEKIMLRDALCEVSNRIRAAADRI